MATLNKARIKKRKTKRIALFCGLTVLFLLLLPLISNVVHQFLSSLGSDIQLKINWDYHNSISMLQNDLKVQKLAIGLSLLFISCCLYLTLGVNQTISSVDTIKIADNIEIPVPAGNGQHGNERFLTPTEKRKLYGVYRYRTGTKADKMPLIKGRGGVVVDFKKSWRWETYYYIKENYHSKILGGTGSFKTRGILLQTIAIQILSGMCAVITDIKGDVYYYTSEFAEKFEYETWTIDLRYPRKSMHYNFMQPILDALQNKDESKAIDYAWDLVSVLVGESKGEPLWKNGESASIAAALMVIALEAPENCKNMENAYYFIAYMCKPDEKGKMPISEYLETFPHSHPARICFAMAEIAADRTRSSFFTSALGTLRLFINPSVAEMTSKSDFNLKDLGRKKVLLYIMLPDDRRTLYPLVSLLITQIYAMQVEVANENGLRLPIPTDYDLDEVGQFPTIPVLSQIITAGRSRGIRAHLFWQDYQQPEKYYKDDVETIKSNCYLTIFRKGDNPKTLKELSEGLGKYTVEVGSASTSITDGKRMNANFSSSSSLIGRSLLEPTEIEKITPPQALVRLTGYYSGINHLPDISKTNFNKLFSLGTEEHNQELVIKKEAERLERPQCQTSLWGIWEEYGKEDEREVLELSDPQHNKERVSFLAL